MDRDLEPQPADAGDSGGPASRRQTDAATTATSERQSVSELVRSYGESSSEGQKRGRSESGDPAPAGKRGARQSSGDTISSPAALGSRNFREHLEVAIEGLENRIAASLSRDLHEFRESLCAEITRLQERVKDLETHVEERDIAIAELTDQLQHSRSEVSALQTRVEDAEMNSRLPCLILSGASMASRHAPRLDPSLRDRAAPGATDRSQSSAAAAAAGAGQGRAVVTSRPADRREGAGQSETAAVASGDRHGARSSAGGDREGQEDVNALVVNTLNRFMPGLNMMASDIDRAHRLPGPNNRVIVRFVRSGQGSVRDQVFSRRLELRGKELFVSESLTKLRSLIFRSLLAAKRENKLYTVYSRGGHVFCKDKQFGAGKRVDSLQAVRELGFSVLER